MRYGWIVGSGLLVLLASIARAQYDLPLYGVTATQYTGGCTSQGSVDGQTVPRCATGQLGQFTLSALWPSPATNGTFSVKNIDFINNGGATTGNKCFWIACTVERNGAVMNATHSPDFSTFTPANISVAGCGTAHKLCSLAAETSTVSAYDPQSVPTDCTGTTCNNHRAVCVVAAIPEANGCTSEANTSIDFVHMVLGIK